ncbi:hypothetical protein ACQUQU_01490 [Thalassolituus sp. LLYu03]|uniref:hypothetical protein n=1 Tax=Thalassolituus sp. LLYu03 TaxID=3421656 RepID=UPI003D2A011E
MSFFSREKTGLRFWLLAFMLTLQTLLPVSEAIAGLVGDADNHHASLTPAQSVSAYVSNAATDVAGNAASDSEHCDHCCLCNGHSAHLALSAQTHQQAAVIALQLPPSASERYRGLNPNAIFRPPIL